MAVSKRLSRVSEKYPQHFERTANQQAEIRDRYLPNKRPLHPTLRRMHHNSSVRPNKALCQF